MDFREEGWGERLMRAITGEPGPVQAQRRLMLAWWLWFAAIVAVILVAIVLSGCAAVPECEEVDGHLLMTPRGLFFLFDEENMRKLDARSQMLQSGKCRLPA